ncbi:OLC1v1026448C1 [Oldenlandia corymbosa var. corymbosa]|uniref:OLC1v1026448C1 n=1 Tax=Oldenlandia corymbosa var. corymbosa TaxID=529605 RepID=A0AAV1C7P2_OLDCO|nr:OLC1v1026448C1 [Oldenlandia corymbosa var. corymbosa]
MKSMKGKLLKKLKTIKTIGYLKPERILLANAADGFVPSSPPNSNVRANNHSVSISEEPKKIVLHCVQPQEPEIIDVSELMKDLEDQELVLSGDFNDKENIRPKTVAKDSVFPKGDLEKSSPLMRRGEFNDKENISVNAMGKDSAFLKGSLENSSPLMKKKEVSQGKERKDSSTEKKVSPLGEIKLLKFRKPDLESGTLFDPSLLEAFEQAVLEVKAQEAERRAEIAERNYQDSSEKEQPLEVQNNEEFSNPLLEFEEKCPPGGSDSVILYTTGLRGIRKTFEDCYSIRSLLKNLRISFFERDISMHSGFKEELWATLGGKLLPPRLFIKGRYIGGADEVLTLHEQGKFKPLLEGIPLDSSDFQCEACDGIRFIVCFNCNGSRKIIPHDGNGNGESDECPHCNENGILICPMCS